MSSHLLREVAEMTTASSGLFQTEVLCEPELTSSLMAIQPFMTLNSVL